MTLTDSGSALVGANVQFTATLLSSFTFTTTQFVSTTVVDGGGEARSMSALAVGADGRPLITYYSGNTFKLAQCQTLNCTAASAIRTIDPNIKAGEPNDTSMAVDRHGRPIIAYQALTTTGPSGTGFAVAKCLDTTCGVVTTTILDAGGIAYSLGIAPDDLAAIAYLDSTRVPSVLKFVKCLDVACTRAAIKTLETTSTGAGLALAIGVDGLPIISYVLNSTNTLTVIKCLTADCETGLKTSLDPQSSPNGWARLGIGSDGLPAISYFDLNSRLKLAKCTNADCTQYTTQTIAATPDVRGGIGMTIGPDNLPVLAYADETDGSLQMAMCQTPDCAFAIRWTVDPAPVRAPSPAMILGADGRLLVSYFNPSTSTIKVAKALPQMTYTVNYGDDSPTLTGGWNARTLPFTHRYQAPGVYTATITAKVGSQSASASTVVVIIGKTYLPSLLRGDSGT